MESVSAQLSGQLGSDRCRESGAAVLQLYVSGSPPITPAAAFAVTPAIHPLRGIVQTLFEVNKRIRGPDPLLQFIACDYLTAMLQQHLQEEEGLILKFDLNALFSQLPGTLVNLKEPETNQARPGLVGCVHAGEHPVEDGVYHDRKKTGGGQACVIDRPTKERDSGGPNGPEWTRKWRESTP